MRYLFQSYYLATQRPKIVYIEEFDKYDNKGNWFCRNIICEKYVCPPFKRYCSKKCSTEFTQWYYNNFFWSKVRSSIFKRDKYTCQNCNLKSPYRIRKKNKLLRLECDHIIPKSLYVQYGYSYDTLDNKIKTTLQFFHNHDNLRTLCFSCHKQKTILYMRSCKKAKDNH